MRIPRGIVDDLRWSIVAPSTPEHAADRLVLRPAEREDLPATSRAHVALLPIGLFPSLGARFVRRWHRTILTSRYGVGVVVIDAAAPQDEIVGFVLGTADHAGYTAELARDRRAMASLALAGLAALVLRPRVALRVVRTRFRPWARRVSRRRAAVRSRERAESVSAPQVAVMTALAVRPDWRKSGVGMLLAERFVELVASTGARWVEAQTSTGPLGATGFYERLGWDAGQARPTPDGDTVRTYRLDLGGAGWTSTA
ncbi:GNAT family N-acetyltransferase [Verrucosispora sioxanthis]|uniref:GNAT family N-acetyltransferase n=1 Tax=Verrucosispora sioxanthis TaxID=2499994 RepID=A0A6M1LAF8_9ACTN|nr:GNAT family N-acetyltransferase [Verrucosispora sioxanthis]NEE66079.1 GNAT family N-acetyltransferase [Verrucosispora sioxanthis]NGM15189.1 GNAT family N-acetyltransferase [Verrucosispora sioxanthis]